MRRRSWIQSLGLRGHSPEVFSWIFTADRLALENGAGNAVLFELGGDPLGLGSSAERKESLGSRCADVQHASRLCVGGAFPIVEDCATSVVRLSQYGRRGLALASQERGLASAVLEATSARAAYDRVGGPAHA